LGFGDDALDFEAGAGGVGCAGVEAEDGGAEFSDGVVEVVDDGGESLGDVGVGAAGGDGVDAEAGGEESLDDDVVEVASDAFAVFEHANVLFGSS